jgi:hypothetical protein
MKERGGNIVFLSRCSHSTEECLSIEDETVFKKNINPPR